MARRLVCLILVLWASVAQAQMCYLDDDGSGAAGFGELPFNSVTDFPSPCDPGFCPRGIVEGTTNEWDCQVCSGGSGGTECSTSPCDLDPATTLDGQGICLADGTNCPAFPTTPTPVLTTTPYPTPTVTATSTWNSPTPTATPTATQTPEACFTDGLGRGGLIAGHPGKCGSPIATATPTVTATATPTATATVTPVLTVTPTSTVTATPTQIATPTRSATPSSTPTTTSTPAATFTAPGATATPTPTATITPSMMAPILTEQVTVPSNGATYYFFMGEPSTTLANVATLLPSNNLNSLGPRGQTTAARYELTRMVCTLGTAPGLGQGWDITLTNTAFQYGLGIRIYNTAVSSTDLSGVAGVGAIAAIAVKFTPVGSPLETNAQCSFEARYAPNL